MLPQVVTVGPIAASSANNICTSQSVASATALTINGSLASSGVATLDAPRRILITSAANDSGITFRVTGTNHTGNPIRETVTGPNTTTAYTVQDFKTVTEIKTSAATAGNVTVGTNGVASSPWQAVTQHLSHCDIGIGVVVSGTVNFTIEYTYDNPNSNYNVIGSQGDDGNYPAKPSVFSLSALASKTANTDGAITTPVYSWRLTLNSQTNPGFATATGIQGGITE